MIAVLLCCPFVLSASSYHWPSSAPNDDREGRDPAVKDRSSACEVQCSNITGGANFLCCQTEQLHTCHPYTQPSIATLVKYFGTRGWHGPLRGTTIL